MDGGSYEIRSIDFEDAYKMSDYSCDFKQANSN